MDLLTIPYIYLKKLKKLYKRIIKLSFNEWIYSNRFYKYLYLNYLIILDNYTYNSISEFHYEYICKWWCWFYR